MLLMAHRHIDTPPDPFGKGGRRDMKQGGVLDIINMNTMAKGINFSKQECTKQSGFDCSQQYLSINHEGQS